MMKIENLSEGLIIKNYKELCSILEIKVEAGNSKKAQLKELERFVGYHKEGQKFIIDEIYDEPLKKEDKRGLCNRTTYEAFKIPIEKENNIGIYKIVYKNYIYIGSTKRSFRCRFQQHYYGTDIQMKHTYELLQKGAKFEMVYDMTGIDDVDLIRMVENLYIKKYLVDPKWNLINKLATSQDHNKVYGLEKVSIKIDKDKLYDAIQLLAQHGLIDEEGVDM